MNLLEPWFSNGTKSLVKSPKLYLSDSGLCAFLLGIDDVRDLAGSPLARPLWEGFVFAQLRRARSNATGGWSLWFLRDRVAEADFLVHRGGSFDLADAQWSTAPSAADLGAARRAARALPEGSVRSLALLCRAERAYPLGADGWALPADAAWPRGEGG